MLFHASIPKELTPVRKFYAYRTVYCQQGPNFAIPVPAVHDWDSINISNIRTNAYCMKYELICHEMVLCFMIDHDAYMKSQHTLKDKS